MKTSLIPSRGEDACAALAAANPAARRLSLSSGNGAYAPPLTLNLQLSTRPRNGCQLSCRTQKALEIYSVFSSTALFAMFSFQLSTAACLCWPSLPSSLPPHLRAIQAQEIQYYLKYLTKGLNYSLGRRCEVPHGYGSRRAGRRCGTACFAANALPRATKSSPQFSSTAFSG